MKKDKTVGAYLGLSLNPSDIKNGFTLNSPGRWVFAIVLGFSFLASIFGPLLLGWDPVVMLGAVFFWAALWLGWPQGKLDSARVCAFIFLQIILCGIFIGLSSWGGKLIYERLGKYVFKMVFQFLVLPMWLLVSKDAFGWFENNFLKKRS